MSRLDKPNEYFVADRLFRVYDHAAAFGQDYANRTGQSLDIMLVAHGLPPFVLETYLPQPD